MTDLAEDVRVTGYPGFVSTSLRSQPPMLIRAAAVAGDIAFVRQALADYRLPKPVPMEWSVALSLVRLHIDEADLWTREIVSPNSSFVRACFLAELGTPTDESVRTLQDIVASPPPYFRFVASRCLAQSWIRRGEPTMAIDMLRDLVFNRLTVDTGRTGPPDLQWAESALTLAELYRATGQASKAEPIEADLHRLLAIADPDLPLLARLHALGNAEAAGNQ